MRARALERVAFHLLCAAGAVAALQLTVVEARREAAVAVVDVDESREGGRIVVNATVANRSRAPRCPTIRVAARDSESRDLQEVVAAQIPGRDAVEPRARAVYRAVLASLPADQLREVAEVRAYVYDDRACPPGTGGRGAAGRNGDRGAPAG